MRFSVVVPTFQRPASLRHCLAAIAGQDLSAGAFEVIVVDDGNDTANRGVVAEFEGRLPVRYLAPISREGPASARNRGASVASGEYLAFIDDDCEAEPGWLSAFDEATRSNGHRESVLFGGRIVNRDADNIYATASQNLIDFLYAWYNVDEQHSRFFATNNVAISRTAFREFGGFDEGFPRAAAEDRDFCDRWREAGGRLEYVPDATVRHANRLTLRSFLLQHEGYGRGAVYLHEARLRRGVALPRLEPFRFYYRLVTWPLSRRFGWRAPALTVLAALSQVAYGVGYYHERARREMQSGDRVIG